MDVKLVNPFIEATVGVLSTMAGLTASADKPFLKSDGVARGDVTAIIGLSGQARGTVAVTFSRECAVSIVSRMLGTGKEPADGELEDAVGEIGNMISGQARRVLEEDGHSLLAAVPSVVSGKNHTITHITKQPVVAVSFSTEAGPFTIEVCFEN